MEDEYFLFVGILVEKGLKIHFLCQHIEKIVILLIEN